ncbi:Rad3-related DNA helicase [Prochlorococcus marinus str. MIT 9515]|uniref:Rad3-related DNA helicase n=1 Tax=Prochlorococcus marinus (strain MIT 9515) TaxID=167542 RepID=A2BYU7_PROM5|nr:DNA helicase [Prochlorococcus marinus]ABM72958.1 Rad3-related DNA helicase [Prochlorococcus marinus str. MIT 9515]
MLEILSHQYLKRFIRFHKTDWNHIYSFGRIISKCLKTNDTYLINSEIFSTNNWIPALLISLFLFEENSTFVLSQEKIEFLKKNQLGDLKKFGFDFILENDQIIFSNHRVYLITLEKLLHDLDLFSSNNHRIIFSGIENIKEDLKNNFRILLLKKNWFHNFDKSSSTYQKIIGTYSFLKKKFFLRKSLNNEYIFLDKEEINFLAQFFYEHSSYSDQFLKVSNALSEGWACWVTLDEINFEWNFYLEPINELSLIKKLFNNNKFVFLSALRKDNFFQNYLKKESIDIDLVMNFKSNFNEKKIVVYAPPRQILPNNPMFTQIIIDKCKKLIIFRKGLTLILSDDLNLKHNLATELASTHGKQVLLETIPSHNNEILCASYVWWINNSYLIKSPEQIIIPLLPIPNMSEPINEITVLNKINLSKDWFREFLLPEAIQKLERSISPLRKNSGKLIILDGRLNKRKWGRSILQSIQPSKQINYVLPYD